jgi:hypothetical protein
MPGGDDPMLLDERVVATLQTGLHTERSISAITVASL